jgi:hypothetical protein
MRLKPSFLLSALIILFLVACVPARTLAPAIEPTHTATGVPASAVPVETDTQVPPPTALPTASSTPQPAPTATNPAILPSPTPLPESDHPVTIAYTKEGAVYLWTEGEGSVALTEAQDVVDLRISDDGELIMYQRQDPVDYAFQELWVVNTRGTPDPRVLVSQSDLQEITPPNPDSWILGAGLLNFTWVPNSHDVAYSTYVLIEGAGSALNHDLRLVDADTLEKSTLFENGQGGIFYYSPDGSQIALSNPESISLVNADGTNSRPDVLTYPSVITYSEYEYHPHPIWASDSASLRVAIPPHDPLADPLPPTGLWSIPVDSSPAELLGNVTAMGFAWPNNAFAPDLQHVIYVSPIGEPSANQRELHTANADGTDDLVYDSGESLEFTGWSPDSQHFIYVVNHEPNKGTYLGGLGEEPLQLSSEPHAMRDFQWVDGTQFAYTIKNGSQWELRLSNLKGEDLGLVDTLPNSTMKYDIQP